MIIPITKEQVITADNLAYMREYYEYRRQGGGYNYNGAPFQQTAGQKYNVNLISQSNVMVGILFEICLFKSLVDGVVNRISNDINYQASSNKSEYIRRKLIANSFSHEMAIGKYDEGYDFLLMNRDGGLKIDAKVYGTKILNNAQSCTNFKLFVDQEQYNRHGADVYIQGFIINQVSQLSFYVAGWKFRDDLVYYADARNPAYGSDVPNLNNINELIEIIYQNEFHPLR